MADHMRADVVERVLAILAPIHHPSYAATMMGTCVKCERAAAAIVTHFGLAEVPTDAE